MIAGAEDTVQDTALAVLGQLLEQGEVLLSTGKVARVKKTNALHDVRVDQLLTQAGYNAHGVDGVTAARFRALLALATIDGKPALYNDPCKNQPFGELAPGSCEKSLYRSIPALPRTVSRGPTW